MIRVMMLVPVLLVIAFFVAKDVKDRMDGTEKVKIIIPWFLPYSSSLLSDSALSTYCLKA